MNKYWFKKYGKSGAFPVTWEGWAYFAFVIGLVTQVTNILKINDVLGSAIAAGAIAAIGFYVMHFKTNQDETFDKVKDKGTYKQLWGALVGLVLLFALMFAIGAVLKVMS